jgi:hypothetical protein
VSEYFIFCDASVSPQNERAVGAYLILNKNEMNSLLLLSDSLLKEKVCKDICYLELNTKKSNVAEIKTFIQSFKTLDFSILTQNKVHVYTDCQRLCSLQSEGNIKLIERDFKNKKGKDLEHKELYQEVIRIYSEYNITSYKVLGHKPNKEKKTSVDKIFSYVDQLSRKRLRSFSSKVPFVKKQ